MKHDLKGHICQVTIMFKLNISLLNYLFPSKKNRELCFHSKPVCVSASSTLQDHRTTELTELSESLINRIRDAKYL